MHLREQAKLTCDTNKIYWEIDKTRVPVHLREQEIISTFGWKNNVIKIECFEKYVDTARPKYGSTCALERASNKLKTPCFHLINSKIRWDINMGVPVHWTGQERIIMVGKNNVM